MIDRCQLSVTCGKAKSEIKAYDLLTDWLISHFLLLRGSYHQIVFFSPPQFSHFPTILFSLSFLTKKNKKNEIFLSILTHKVR